MTILEVGEKIILRESLRNPGLSLPNFFVWISNFFLYGRVGVVGFYARVGVVVYDSDFVSRTTTREDR